MENKRYLVRGKRIDNGEWIEGWVVVTGHSDVTDKAGHYLRTEYCYQISPCDYSHRVCVDPSTIEPVAVKVIKKIEDDFIVDYHCPNCEHVLHAHYKAIKSPTKLSVNYCPKCGQRLDWGGKD